MKRRIKNKKKVILVDTSHILYVVYFGLPEAERYAKAIIAGFLNRVLQLMVENNMTDLVFCWDSPKSIRKDRYGFYKEKRIKDKKKDKNLKYMYEAKNELQTILPAIGFNAHVEVDGYESDDTMCEMVRRYPNIRFIIVANDNDLLQILKYRNLIGLFNCRENKLTTYQDFVSTYGIKPDYWHLFKALAGCSSDEIPGIPGIGKTYALRFLKDELEDDSKPMQLIYEARNTIFLRNHWLVTLPLPGLKKHRFKILKNDLTRKKLRTMCLAYDIEVSNEWKRFCK